MHFLIKIWIKEKSKLGVRSEKNVETCETWNTCFKVLGMDLRSGAWKVVKFWESMNQTSKPVRHEIDFVKVLGMDLRSGAWKVVKFWKKYESMKNQGLGSSDSKDLRFIEMILDLHKFGNTPGILLASIKWNGTKVSLHNQRFQNHLHKCVVLVFLKI